MVVVIGLSTGERYRVDRREMLHNVAQKVNDARGTGHLIELFDDRTPSRQFHIDPDQVVSITDDGHPY